MTNKGRHRAQTRRAPARVFAGAAATAVAAGVALPAVAQAAPSDPLPPCGPPGVGSGCAADITIPGVDTTGINNAITGLLSPTAGAPGPAEIAAGSVAASAAVGAAVLIGPYIAAIPVAASIDLNKMITGDPNGSIQS